MIKSLIKLSTLLDAHGFYQDANMIDHLIVKLSTSTKCTAIFKYPIEFIDGGHTDIFHYKSNSCGQILGAIPQVLSKKHSQVWFLKKKYELPAQARLLTVKLLEERMLGNIECECYIEDN